MSKAFAVLRWVVRESLITIGLLAVGLVLLAWWGLSNDGDLKKSKAAQAAPLVSHAGPGAAIDAGPGAGNAAPVEGAADGKPSGAAVVEVCDCASGAVCVGSRGGRFCVDASGSKRYR